MFRQIWMGALFAACLTASTAFAADQNKVLGTWKLVSYNVEIQSSGAKMPMMGEHPTGKAAFLPDGHVFFILTAEARKPAKTEKERAELLSTVVAYTGTYTVEGDKWTTHVEVAWNPEWVGTDQVRSFTLNGKYLEVLTPWRIMPNWADKGMTRSIIKFERIE